MTKLSYETRINAPADAVWDALADFGGVWRYSPTVNESHSTSEATTGLGAERHCDLTFAGASVEERIVDWQEGRSMDVQIVEGKRTPPMTDIIAHFELEPDGDATIVRASMRYDMKFGPLGWAMDHTMVRPKFGSAFSQILAGLKHYLETGETVTGEVEIDEQAVQAVAA
jgi:carbon monoxide dehydrogenase subunit G